MKQYSRKLYWCGQLVAFSILALGLTGQPVGAQVSSDAKTITNSQDHVTVAAPRPWTLEEMQSAKPYPMPTFTNADGQIDETDLNLAPPGPAGFVAGSPTGAATTATGVMVNGSTGEGALDEASSFPLSNPYSYPGPYTLLSVNRIASYTTFPFRTIGKLFFRQGGGSYVCSASVIGTKGIVTAGHCVHKGNNNSTGWSTNVIFVPAYSNGSAPYGQWPISTLHTFTDWYAHGANGDMDHDWGAGKTSHQIKGKYLGQKVGYLGYAWNFSRNQHWWELGYPQASPFNGKWMYTCTASYAYNSPYYSGGPAPMTTGCNMTGGCSGGPWIMRFSTGNYVNGVNSHRSTARPQELSSPYADSNTKTGIFDWARAQ